ncbi:hypothetical protein JCM3766R1_000871 [Sporobolomyces carnicolor]
MDASQFSFEAPRPAPDAPQSSLHSLFSSHLPSTSDATLSTLDLLSQAFLKHDTDSQVKQELEQLRGELRSEYRPRVKAIKADFFARTVWQADEESTDDALTERDRGNEDEEEDQPVRVPTIISDADSQAEMSAAVDLAAEAEITKGVREAEARIIRGVRTTKTLECEIWLSQTILDAYEASGGEEAGAARFVQDRLEDRLFEVGVDPIAILQSPSASSTSS